MRRTPAGPRDFIRVHKHFISETVGTHASVSLDACRRLKVILSEALVSRDSLSGRPALSADSPADLSIKLLNSLLMGDEVGGPENLNRGRGVSRQAAANIRRVYIYMPA